MGASFYVTLVVLGLVIGINIAGPIIKVSYEKKAKPQPPSAKDSLLSTDGVGFAPDNQLP